MKSSAYKLAWNRNYYKKEGQFRHLQREYGISKEQYLEMVKKQKGKCVICKRVPKGKLCVDHDHSIGLVRQLLCRTCNAALGSFGHDVKVLRRAIKYMKFHTPLESLCLKKKP